VPVAQIRPKPEADIAIDTEALFGETLNVFDRHNGWAWVQLDADGYVGYMPKPISRLRPGPARPPIW
jgi:hypothetical protein